MKLAIVIPTYQRLDSSTPYYLTRALNSIRAQTHTDYRVFLIGDQYTNNSEFLNIASLIDKDKIHYENLKFAKERNTYKFGSKELWCSGGVNATNVGINRALSQGYEWICHLDHDDWWDNDHLLAINSVIEQISDLGFVYTCSEHINRYLPFVPLNESLVHSYPTPCNIVHSSVCINHLRIPFYYRDVFAETGIVLEADIDMWIRITDFMMNNSIKSMLYQKITTHHVLERH